MSVISSRYVPYPTRRIRYHIAKLLDETEDAQSENLRWPWALQESSKSFKATLVRSSLPQAELMSALTSLTLAPQMDL